MPTAIELMDLRLNCDMMPPDQQEALDIAVGVAERLRQFTEPDEQIVPEVDHESKLCAIASKSSKLSGRGVDDVRAVNPSSPVDPPRRRGRPIDPRTTWCLEQYDDERLTPAKIRDKWEALSDEKRKGPLFNDGEPNWKNRARNCIENHIKRHRPNGRMGRN